jgi:hypothetical protein
MILSRAELRSLVELTHQSPHTLLGMHSCSATPSLLDVAFGLPHPAIVLRCRKAVWLW